MEMVLSYLKLLCFDIFLDRLQISTVYLSKFNRFPYQVSNYRPPDGQCKPFVSKLWFICPLLPPYTNDITEYISLQFFPVHRSWLHLIGLYIISGEDAVHLNN
jgi:hypothetical protein